MWLRLGRGSGPPARLSRSYESGSSFCRLLAARRPGISGVRGMTILGPAAGSPHASYADSGGSNH